MARIARQHIVTSKGGFFRVFNRVAGAPRYFPFRQPCVRRKFIRWLRYCLRISCIGCVGYVLMGNHYHLVVRAARFRRLPRKKLHRYAQARWGRLWRLRTRFWSDERWLRFNHHIFSLGVFMKDLQGPFASWFNRHFDRRGHLWAQRYKCVKLEDCRSLRECLLYIELNPVRAGLCKRPEQWKEGSAYLRWLGQDRYLMTLETIFPEIGKKQRYAHYRGSLLYRGMTPSQERQQAIDPEMVRIEQSRGFPRPGLYLKRLRFLSDGLILGTSDEIRDHLQRLRAKGVYRLRRNPILHFEGLFCTLREQRSHARS